jgi:hypothetical protein
MIICSIIIRAEQTYLNNKIYGLLGSPYPVMAQLDIYHFLSINSRGFELKAQISNDYPLEHSSHFILHNLGRI